MAPWGTSSNRGIQKPLKFIIRKNERKPFNKNFNDLHIKGIKVKTLTLQWTLLCKNKRLVWLTVAREAKKYQLLLDTMVLSKTSFIYHINTHTVISFINFYIIFNKFKDYLYAFLERQILD